MPTDQRSAHSPGFIASYVLNMKASGVSDAEIENWLTDKNLSYDDMKQVYQEMEYNAANKLDEHNKNFQRGALVFVLGALVTLVTFAMAANGGRYLVAWGAVIFGGIRMYKGWKDKSRCSLLLARIQQEREILVNNTPRSAGEMTV